jgi:hypothetical protein
MRKLLMTMPLTAAVLAACGGGGGDDRTAGDRRSADRSTTTETAEPDGTTSEQPSTTAGPSTTTTVAPEPAAPSTTTPVPAEPATAPRPRPDGQRFVCPEGGIAEVRRLQRSVDQGHQAWRLLAEPVATACSYPDGVIDADGTDRYRVTDPVTLDAVRVELAQPLGPGTIWVVTRITPV